MHQLGNEIELVEIKLVPRNRGVVIQGRLALFAHRIHGRVDFLQLAANRIFDDLRPGLIGFSQDNGIGVAGATIAAESFIGLFSHMRPSHHHRNSRRANRVRHAIRSGDHPGHGADTNQSDVLVADELRNLGLVHRLGIAIEQQDFISGYPLHDKIIIVTNCGRICLGHKKINFSTVFAGQAVGIKEIHDDIWLVSFMDYDLGYFDLETRVLEPLDNPFGPKLLPV